MLICINDACLLSTYHTYIRHCANILHLLAHIIQQPCEEDVIPFPKIEGMTEVNQLALGQKREVALRFHTRPLPHQTPSTRQAASPGPQKPHLWPLSYLLTGTEQSPFSFSAALGWSSPGPHPGLPRPGLHVTSTSTPHAGCSLPISVSFSFKDRVLDGKYRCKSGFEKFYFHFFIHQPYHNKSELWALFLSFLPFLTNPKSPFGHLINMHYRENLV